MNERLEIEIEMTRKAVTSALYLTLLSLERLQQLTGQLSMIYGPIIRAHSDFTIQEYERRERELTK